MEEMESIRLEALMRINNLAIQDDDFRREGIRNLGRVLRKSGFVLSPEEVIILEDFRKEAAGWDDEDLVECLRRQTGQTRWGL